MLARVDFDGVTIMHNRLSRANSVTRAARPNLTKDEQRAHFAEKNARRKQTQRLAQSHETMAAAIRRGRNQRRVGGGVFGNAKPFRFNVLAAGTSAEYRAESKRPTSPEKVMAQENAA